MASVTLSHVFKNYGTTQVVHGVDINIADGEFCVLVGPSGCGKSTLLRRVAGFIDSPAMNFLNGHLNGDGTALVSGATLPAASKSTGKITHGVRPEHLSFGVEGQGLKAVVDVVEPTGADTMVVAHVASDSKKLEVQITQRDRVSCKHGDTVWLVPDASRIHLFDSASGQRIN